MVPIAPLPSYANEPDAWICKRLVSRPGWTTYAIVNSGEYVWAALHPSDWYPPRRPKPHTTTSAAYVVHKAANQRWFAAPGDVLELPGGYFRYIFRADATLSVANESVSELASSALSVVQKKSLAYLKHNSLTRTAFIDCAQAYVKQANLKLEAHPDQAAVEKYLDDTLELGKAWTTCTTSWSDAFDPEAVSSESKAAERVATYDAAEEATKLVRNSEVIDEKVSWLTRLFTLVERK